MVNSIEIEYLDPKKEFKVGSVKTIAVPSNNMRDIKNVYLNLKKNESNADMLSQSFGTVPEITPISSQSDNQKVENVGQTVQISPIPVVQNTNLEKEPVSLDVNAISMPEVSSPVTVVNDVPNGSTEEPMNTKTVEPVVESATFEEGNNVVNEVPKVSAPIYESGFKVSDAPNIFDNPINTMGENNNAVDNFNVFKQPVFEETKEPLKEPVFESDINDEIIYTEIAILENNIKYYEGLADNCRKIIELRKNQIKKGEDIVNLENTASNLFKNNGVLDEEQVMGETPMPTLRSA